MSKSLIVKFEGDASSLRRAYAQADLMAKEYGVTTTREMGKATRASEHHVGQMEHMHVRLRKSFGGLTASAGGLAAGLVGVGGVYEGFKKSAEVALETEAANKRLQVALKDSEVSWKANRKEIEAWLSKTSVAKGFLETDLTQAMARAVAATGSVTKAQGLLNTSMDLAKFKNVDLATASDALIRVHAGNTRALKALGISLVPVTTQTDKLKASTAHATVEQKKAAKQLDLTATEHLALAKVQKLTAGQADRAANTTAGHYASLRAEIHQVEGAIGKALLPEMDKLAKFGLKATEDLKKNWPAIKKDIGDVVTPIEDVAKGAWNLGKAHPGIAKVAGSLALAAIAAKKLHNLTGVGHLLGGVGRLFGGGSALGGGGGGVVGKVLGKEAPVPVYVTNMGGGFGPGKGLPGSGPVSTIERDAAKAEPKILRFLKGAGNKLPVVGAGLTGIAFGYHELLKTQHTPRDSADGRNATAIQGITRGVGPADAKIQALRKHIDELRTAQDKWARMGAPNATFNDYQGQIARTNAAIKKLGGTITGARTSTAADWKGISKVAVGALGDVADAAQHNGRLTRERVHDAFLTTRQQSAKTFGGLRADVTSAMTSLASATGTKSAQARKSVADNSEGARRSGAGSFARLASSIDGSVNQAARAVGGGFTKINKETRAEMSALGVVGKAASSIANIKFARGGIPNPGSGARDDHILLSPQGMPVAALSGTEGILNTPQMAEVSDALSLKKALGAGRYGSLTELWGSGMTHHAKGGKLRKYAGGGRFDATTLGLGQTIFSRGRAAGADATHIVAALDAAMTETSGVSSGRIVNPIGGDASSSGLFQMLSDKGTLAQRHDPVFASDWFFRTSRGKTGTPPIIAQATEVSAYPGRYATNWAAAGALFNALSHGHYKAAGGGGGGFKAIHDPAWTGPGGALGAIGKAALHKGTRAANSRLRSASARAAAAVGGSRGSGFSLGPAGKGGIGSFDGRSVASWIIPELAYARKHGWHGSVTSGFRSYAQQAALYANRASNPNPVAVPGSSNHEGSAYPRGAVDVSDIPGFQSAIRGYPGARKLIWYGSGDPVHFSGTGRRRGGLLRRFGGGGPLASIARAARHPAHQSLNINPGTGKLETHTAKQWHVIGVKYRHAHPHGSTIVKRRNPYNNRVEKHSENEWRTIGLGYSVFTHEHPGRLLPHGVTRGIDRATHVIGGYDAAIAGADTTLGFDTRIAGQSTEDTTTARGALLHIAEDNLLLSDNRRKRLQMRKQLVQIRREVKRIKAAMKRLRAELVPYRSMKSPGTPPARRRAITAAINAYKTQLRGYATQAKQLGVDMRTVGLDIGDLQREEHAVEHQGGMMGDEQAALDKVTLKENAGVITPEQAWNQRHFIRQAALGGKFGNLTSDQRLGVLADDRSDTDNPAASAAGGTATADAHLQAAQALQDAASSLAQIGNRNLGINQAELVGEFVDMLSGQIGGQTFNRAQAAGSGVRASY